VQTSSITTSYLNFDANTQAKWLKDPAGFIKAADAKFPALLKK
jgi:hypothetical protein